MGFFSKIFKGIKKVFKKIGKGIKSAFKSIGKFMGKIGILGQIGLGLLLPGLGQFLGSWAGTLMGSSSVVARAAGQFINASINIGTKVGKTFKTITEGVTNVIGETVGAVANKLGLADPVKNLTGIDISQKDFGSVFNKVGEGMTNALDAGKDLFSTSTLTETNPFTQEILDKKEFEGSVETLKDDLENAIADKKFAESETMTDLRGQLQEAIDGQKSLLEPPAPTIDTTTQQVTSGLQERLDELSASFETQAQKETGLATGQLKVNKQDPTVDPSTLGPYEKPELTLAEKARERFKKEVVRTPEKFVERFTTGLANRASGNVPTSTTNVSYGAVPTIPLETYQPIPFMNTLDPMQYISAYNSGQGIIGHTGLLHDVHSAVFSERMKR